MQQTRTPAAERTPIIIDQLIEAAKRKREECEKRFFRFKVGSRYGPGREFVMREQIANIIGWVTTGGLCLPLAVIKDISQNNMSSSNI